MSGAEQPTDAACALCGNDAPNAQDAGDILIFLPGQDHIDTAIEQLTDASRDTSRRHEMRLVPMALYSALPPADQLRVFEPLPKGHRKVSSSRLALSPFAQADAAV